MAAGPQRRTTPVKHLLAHLVPVELALKERAAAIERDGLAEAADMDPAVTGALQVILPAEFRALAAELHHW